MGEFFTSFDDAWSSFLTRYEPMEDYLEQFPDHDAVLAGWLIPVDQQLAPRFGEVQEALAPLPWIRPAPHHWLHVWIGGATWLGAETDAGHIVEQAREALAGVPAFRMALPRLNCFHTAVVAEVESDGPRELAARLFPGRDLSTFLPHVTISVPTEPGPAEGLRDHLVPLRETPLGEQEVRRVDLCLVPASRATVFQPWTVAGSVELGT